MEKKKGNVKKVEKIENTKNCSSLFEQIEKYLRQMLVTLQYHFKTIGKEARLSNLTYQIIRDTFIILSLDAEENICRMA